MTTKKMTYLNLPFGFIFLTILATSFPSLARASTGNNSMAMISVAGGIAMPSFSTSLNTNAAGIVETPGTQLLIQGETNSDSSDSLLAGGMSYGNGTVGLGAGANHGTRNNTTSAYFGLGFAIHSIHTM